jgi:hypothetical protein
LQEIPYFSNRDSERYSFFLLRKIQLTIRQQKDTLFGVLRTPITDYIVPFLILIDTLYDIITLILLVRVSLTGQVIIPTNTSFILMVLYFLSILHTRYTIGQIIAVQCPRVVPPMVNCDIFFWPAGFGPTAAVVYTVINCLEVARPRVAGVCVVIILVHPFFAFERQKLLVFRRI